MKALISGCLMMLMLGGATTGLTAQSGAKEETKKAGSAIKEAGVALAGADAADG